MRSSAYNTIRTNKLLFISYVSKAPVCMIDEMCLRDLLVYSNTVGLRTACRYDGDVGVSLIDIVIGKGNATCEKFIKYLCQVEITKDPALSELHQLGTHDVPADAENERKRGTDSYDRLFKIKPLCTDDFQKAVLRHKRDLAPIISLRAAYFIEALAQHEVLCGYHKEVLERAVYGIEFHGASEVVDAIMFRGEQHCKSFLEMVRNPEFLARFPADHKLLNVLQAYRPED